MAAPLYKIEQHLYYSRIFICHSYLGGGGGLQLGGGLIDNKPQGYYRWVEGGGFVTATIGGYGGIGMGTIGGTGAKSGYWEYGYYKYEIVNNLPGANHTSHFTTTESVILPVGESGNYTFFVRVIPVEPVTNAFASNDFAADGTPTVVHLTPPPDLTVTNVTVANTALAGHSINFNYTVKNSGLTSTPNGNWIDAIYLSTDTTLDAQDTKLGELNHTCALQVGESYIANAALSLPNGIAGQYYLIASSDGQNTVFELNNANNSLASTAISIQNRPADLVVNTVATPTASQAGRSILVSWQVSNQGLGDTVIDGWDDAVIASLDDIIGNADDVLSSDAY